MAKKASPEKGATKLKIASICAREEEISKKLLPHTAPIFASSTYIYESPEHAARVFEGKEEAFIYSRWSNPNAELAEQKILALETFGLKGVDATALLFASGMAAISTLFQSVLKRGDTLIAQGNIYGTSIDYFNHFGELAGVKVVYADFGNLDALKTLVAKDKKVKMLYAETPSNPTVNCYDLKTLSTIAHAAGAVMAADNTFASPVLQQPFAFGVDYIIHSATKYLNGHGNALSGVLLGRDKKMMKEAWKVRKLHGSIAPAFDSWLLSQGMKTLPLRMAAHSANALEVASYFEKHKAIKKVHYLGLETHPQHALAAQQMKAYSGVLSLELKDGYKAGKRLMEKVRFCRLTASLGTTDTLIQHPASMSHYFVPKAQREAYGITDGLVRLSVGIEDAQDIIADLEQGLLAKGK
jgi:methionine-gamma-lyase